MSKSGSLSPQCNTKRTKSIICLIYNESNYLNHKRLSEGLSIRIPINMLLHTGLCSFYRVQGATAKKFSTVAESMEPWPHSNRARYLIRFHAVSEVAKYNLCIDLKFNR